MIKGLIKSGINKNKINRINKQINFVFIYRGIQILKLTIDLIILLNLFIGFISDNDLKVNRDKYGSNVNEAERWNILTSKVNKYDLIVLLKKRIN